MKISLKYLRQVIKEELESALTEKEMLYNHYSELYNKLHHSRLEEPDRRTYDEWTEEDLRALRDDVEAELDAAAEEAEAARVGFIAQEPYPGEELPPSGGMGRGPR